MSYTFTQDISDGQKITPESITEIRNDINSERARRLLPTYNFVQPINKGNKITLAVVQELKTALIGIKTCSIPDGNGEILNEVIDLYKAQLNTLNNATLTPVYQWVYSGWQYVNNADGNNNRHMMNAQGAGQFFPGLHYIWNTGTVGEGAALAGYSAWDGVHNGYNFLYQRLVDANLNPIGINYDVIYMCGPYVTETHTTDAKWGNTDNYFYQIQRAQRVIAYYE